MSEKSLNLVWFGTAVQLGFDVSSFDCHITNGVFLVLVFIGDSLIWWVFYSSTSEPKRPRNRTNRIIISDWRNDFHFPLCSAHFESFCPKSIYVITPLQYSKPFHGIVASTMALFFVFFWTSFKEALIGFLLSLARFGKSQYIGDNIFVSLICQFFWSKFNFFDFLLFSSLLIGSLLNFVHFLFVKRDWAHTSHETFLLFGLTGILG